MNDAQKGKVMKVVTESGYAVKDKDGFLLIDGEGVIVYTRDGIDFTNVLSGVKSKLINVSLRACDPLNDPDELVDVHGK